MEKQHLTQVRALERRIAKLEAAVAKEHSHAITIRNQWFEIFEHRQKECDRMVAETLKKAAVVKFKKPTKDDLSNLHMFNPYGSIPILDDDGDSTGWNIYMFRVDDKDIQNIINSSYAVKMELPECITDYDSFFEDLGFPKEAVRNGDVRIIKSNSRYITISYGDKSKEIEKSRLEKYKVMVQTKCVVLKIKALWNSSENNLYGIDKKKAIKCIPDIENYEYVPVNNSMLAKAEIPFLIFERNRGKCFIEMY